MHSDAVDPDEPTDFPVGRLTVDPAQGWVRFPSGAQGGYHEAVSGGVVQKEAFEVEPLTDLADALGALAEADNALTFWWLTTTDDPQAFYADQLDFDLPPIFRAWGPGELGAVVEIEGLHRHQDEDFEASIPGAVPPHRG